MAQQMAKKTSSGAKSKSAPAPTPITALFKNGKAVPIPPPNSGGSKAVDPNDCTLKHTELDVQNGQVAFAVAGGGKTAWHGYGNEIFKTDTMAQVAKKAGMEFSVTTAPVEYVDSDGKRHKMHDTLVNYRTDTKAALGIVSKDFKNVQPSQVLEFFRDFCADNKLTMETAGALRGGKTVWALAKLGKDFDFLLPGADKIDSYLRLQTGFDAKRATDAIATCIRQVCKNTENMINLADQHAYKTPHTSVFDAEALKTAMGMLGEQHKITAKFWNELVKRKVTQKERDTYFCELFGLSLEDKNGKDKDGESLITTRARNTLDALTAAFVSGPGHGLKSADGTAYGLLQAVTYWSDHQASIKGSKEDPTARLNASWYGTGARIKKDAQFMAATLAGCAELVFPDLVAA
jgi:phage/plasmid-like protein (TIGR03299 family)